MKQSKDVELAIKESKKIAIAIGSNKIRPEHLFLAMIENEESEVYKVLLDIGIDMVEVKKTLTIWSNEVQNQIGIQKLRSNAIIGLSVETDKILKDAIKFTNEMEENEVSSGYLLYVILNDDGNLVNEMFKKSPVIFKSLKNRLSGNEDDIYELDMETESEMSDMEDISNMEEYTSKNKKNSLIEKFGTDLTKLAQEGILDPVVGRKDEIKRISQILSRRKKNNPVLVGEPGVGKSAIVEGIAQLIVDGKVPENLREKRIVTLDMGSLVAGTKYRGEFEQRLRGIIKEMEEDSNIVLFIDEIHTIIGAGSAQGSLDAANMLKPALSRGKFRCIGATTIDEYRKYIEKDAALERRFQKVTVDPNSKEESLEILMNLKERYEEFHGVSYTDEALASCVELTDKYMSEKHLPDKAIDAMDEAGSKVHVNRTIKVPLIITDLEDKISTVKKEKVDLVAKQLFEDAAKKRDIERELQARLEIEKKKWNEEKSEIRFAN